MEQQITRRLSLLLKGPLSERFQAVAGEEISCQLKKPYVPDNTQRSTDWPVRTFEQWRDFYNSKQNESECPHDILMTEDKEALCHWLCIFVMEVRKKSGDPYTPRSLVQLMSGLNRKISSDGSGANIMDSKCPFFQPLDTVLDNLLRSLHSQGIGTMRNQEGLVTFDEENRL